MFGFYLQTGDILKLPSHAPPLKEYPQMCSTGSYIRPDLIPEIYQVMPCFTKSVKPEDNIPLFIPMNFNNSHLEPVPIEKNKRFCLMFYPEPDHPPNSNVLIKEYWKSIRPMIL